MFIATRRESRLPAKLLLWLMLAASAGLATWFALRGYLSPELLLYFSNAFSC